MRKFRTAAVLGATLALAAASAAATDIGTGDPWDQALAYYAGVAPAAD